MLNIVTCISDYRQGLDWMIGFNDTLYTQLETTFNYSAVAGLHTLQFTGTQALEFSGFTSRVLATDLQSSHCHSSTHEVFFPESNSFLAISSQLPPTADSVNSISPLPSSYPYRLASRNSTNSNDLLCLFIIPRHGPQRKHSLSIVDNARLQHRCVATKFIRLLLAYSLQRKRVCRSCLAVNVSSDFTIRDFGRHVTGLTGRCLQLRRF
jgi:hypothetical protein